MMKFRLTTLAEFTERIAAEYGDVSVKFKDEDDDLILLHETNWDLLVSEAETKRSVNLVISQRQESRLSEQVIRQLGIATTTEVRSIIYILQPILISSIGGYCGQLKW
jgi:hypothetical protein